jgi:hypothetical protein
VLEPLPVEVEPLVVPLVEPVVPVVLPVLPAEPDAVEPLGVLIDAEAEALSKVPVISTLWPTWLFSLSLSLTFRRYVLPDAADADMPGDDEVAPVVPDAVPLVVPDADVLGAVDGDEVEPLVPYVDELAPAAAAALCVALVSVQLPSDPWRQPVTVTVAALLLLGLCAEELPLVPVGSLAVSCDPLVVVGLSSAVVLCVPLCAATLTAKAHANATLVAVPNTRFMCSSSCWGHPGHRAMTTSRGFAICKVHAHLHVAEVERAQPGQYRGANRRPYRTNGRGDGRRAYRRASLGVHGAASSWTRPRVPAGPACA